MKWRYVDTHAHVNLGPFRADSDEVLARSRARLVAHINVGTTIKTSARAVSIAQDEDWAWAIVGLHPTEAASGRRDEEGVSDGGTPLVSKVETFNEEAFRSLARSSPKVVGIGECGLDYYHCPPESYAAQEAALVAQIKLANEISLPLMIHAREPKPGAQSPTGRSVYDDIHDMLKTHSQVPGNVHFFAGSEAQAKRFFAIGFSVSFTGVITFAKVYEETVRVLPLERIHAETDCPYVAPVPYRGTRSEPWHVVEVVKKIAAIKNLPEARVAEQLLHNAHQLYPALAAAAAPSAG
jgi:TatD DNase family protein